MVLWRGFLKTGLLKHLSLREPAPLQGDALRHFCRSLPVGFPFPFMSYASKSCGRQSSCLRQAVSAWICAFWPLEVIRETGGKKLICHRRIPGQDFLWDPLVSAHQQLTQNSCTYPAFQQIGSWCLRSFRFISGVLLVLLPFSLSVLTALVSPYILSKSCSDSLKSSRQRAAICIFSLQLQLSLLALFPHS